MSEDEMWLYFHKRLTTELYRAVADVMEDSNINSHIEENKYAIDCFNYYLPYVSSRPDHIIMRSKEFLNSTSGKVADCNV
jgi:hypothetical protein